MGGWCRSRHGRAPANVAVFIAVPLPLIDRRRKTPFPLLFVTGVELVVASRTISTFMGESACKEGLRRKRHWDHVPHRGLRHHLPPRCFLFVIAKSFDIFTFSVACGDSGGRGGCGVATLAQARHQAAVVLVPRMLGFREIAATRLIIIKKKKDNYDWRTLFSKQTM